MVRKALSKKHLAGLHCECISQTNWQAGKAPPTVVCSHSTCSMTVYVSLFGGVSVEDIYGGIVINALSIYTVLLHRHVGLFFRVCAHWKETGLVKRQGVSRLYCT